MDNFYIDGVRVPNIKGKVRNLDNMTNNEKNDYFGTLSKGKGSNSRLARDFDSSVSRLINFKDNEPENGYTKEEKDNFRKSLLLEPLKNMESTIPVNNPAMIYYTDEEKRKLVENTLLEN